MGSLSQTPPGTFVPGVSRTRRTGLLPLHGRGRVMRATPPDGRGLSCAREHTYLLGSHAFANGSLSRGNRDRPTAVLFLARTNPPTSPRSTSGWTGGASLAPTSPGVKTLTAPPARMANVIGNGGTGLTSSRETAMGLYGVGTLAA
jgi:hypothetical protein